MRALLDQILKRFIVLGRLTIRWPDGSISSYTGEAGPEAVIELKDARTVRRRTRSSSRAAGSDERTAATAEAELVEVIAAHYLDAYDAAPEADDATALAKTFDRKLASTT